MSLSSWFKKLYEMERSLQSFTFWDLTLVQGVPQTQESKDPKSLTQNGQISVYSLHTLIPKYAN